MRLTSVARMDLPEGRLRSFALSAGPPQGAVPVSFDQGRHVAAGDRPGSWMAVSFVLAAVPSADDLERVWRVVLSRHGTLRTAFDDNGSGVPELHRVDLADGAWVEHEDDGSGVRNRLRMLLDEVCRPYSRPSHRLCLIDPGDGSCVVVVGADHSHVDAWSLLVLVRDLTSGLDDLAAGAPICGQLPPAADFADHTAALVALPPAPQEVRQRWHELIDAGDGFMPTFPLPLGDVSEPRDEVVVVHDVLDEDELAAFEQSARAQQVRMIALAVSVMTRVTRRFADAPLRAVLPVHSRGEQRWHDSVGWFITNSILECAQEDVTDCSEAVGEAVLLGSYPLAPIMARYGGMPQGPGMFALSWLDNRRLPVAVDPVYRPQHVSAVIRTDGVMVWFVANATGLHLRCRYPDTPQARESVERWLGAVRDGVRAAAG